MISKWIQIGAPVVLASISAIVLLRDWKWHDKRTIAYRRFTTIMLVVWMAAAVALGWSLWKTYPPPKSQPAFSFYVNGKPIQNGAQLSLAVTNRSQALLLAVENRGTAPAERLTVHAITPTGLFRPAAGWSENPPGFDITDGVLSNRNGKIHYQIEATSIIDPTCFFVCPPLATIDGLSLPCSFGLAVVASCTEGPRDAAVAIISLLEDVDDSPEK